jgi:hypothetical protein
MEDSISETLKERQNRLKGEAYARDHIFGENQVIRLAELPFNWMLKHIDCFVSQSRGNESIEEVTIPLFSNDGEDHAFWDKVGQAIGNLQALKTLRISTFCDDEDDDEYTDPPTHDWEILERILSHIRQKVSVDFEDNNPRHPLDAEESRSFARVIHRHPTITCFADNIGLFPYEASDALYSALATLPALESISLSHYQHYTGTWPENESALADPESLGRLLRVSSLRYVSFSHFYFTHPLWRATVNAFVEGTALTKLEFECCDFAAFKVDWSPIFLALGKNTGLKTLKIKLHGPTDELLCAAMEKGLAMNETLESMELNGFHLRNNSAHLESRAFSFLRTNQTLKTLVIGVIGATDLCLSAFKIEVTAMLQENTSLESIFFRIHDLVKQPEECVALVTSLEKNMTLKKLQCNDETVQLTHDEDKRMAKILKKNYALESLPDFYLENRPGDVGAILRLNEAGRRYLIEDGSSVSKGVKVLSAVSYDIDCVLFHLLENPRLCDRSAVEMGSLSAEDASIANRNGKREQDEALAEGKESRRRRA